MKAILTFTTDTGIVETYTWEITPNCMSVKNILEIVKYYI